LSAKIYIEAEDTWRYFKENEDDLENVMHLVAENEDYGVEIYLENEGGLPGFSAYVDSDLMLTERAINEKDCEITAARIYDDYLTERFFETLGEHDDSLTKVDELTIIDEREDELDLVFEDLLHIASDGKADTYEILEQVKDDVLELLYRKYKISIWRPMYLVDEDGEEFYEEYPYECMIFDDEEPEKKGA